MVHRLQVHFMIGKWSPFIESDCGCWHLFSFNVALSMDGPQEYERMNVQVLLSYFVRDTKKPCLSLYPTSLAPHPQDKHWAWPYLPFAQLQLLKMHFSPPSSVHSIWFPRGGQMAKVTWKTPPADPFSTEPRRTPWVIGSWLGMESPPGHLNVLELNYFNSTSGWLSFA